MAEYIEREALIKAINDKETEGYTLCMPMKLKTHYVAGLHKAMRFVEKAPTADVVEVVRCKDCQHARQTVYGNYHCLVDHRLAHEETDYCSYGERKEGAEQ